MCANPLAESGHQRLIAQDGGIVDEYGDTARALLEIGDGVLYLFFGADVTAHEFETGNRRRRLQSFGVAVECPDACAARSQSTREGETKPGRRPGDDDPLLGDRHEPEACSRSRMRTRSATDSTSIASSIGTCLWN